MKHRWHMTHMCCLFHLVPFLEYILHIHFSPLCCSRMFLVGLTGGISSGKSTVSSMLRELGCPIIDADVVARKGLWWIQHTRPRPKRTLTLSIQPPHPLSLQSHNGPPADLSHQKTSSKWNVDVCPRAPHTHTSLTKLRLVWLCLLYYWSGHEEAQACRTFIKTNAWRGSMNHDVCPPRWLLGRCCTFVLGDRKVTDVGDQRTA